MTIDDRYTVSGRLTNRKTRAVKGPVKVAFSTVNGRLGFIIGKRTFRVKKKSRRQFSVRVKAKAPYGAGPILVTALWRDADAYQGWVDNPARAATAGDLSLLVDGELTEATRGELYDVVLAVPAVSGR